MRQKKKWQVLMYGYTDLSQLKSYFLMLSDIQFHFEAIQQAGFENLILFDFDLV